VRYAFNYSSNGFLEIQWYLFSAIFLLCAGYALKRNAHVRIDVVSSHFSPRVLAWIDIVGTIFFWRRWPARCSTCRGRSSSIPSSARSIPPTPVA
jgi:TRAP-type mannitol/chloroaromatic compound transport system permease small subunit